MRRMLPCPNLPNRSSTLPRLEMSMSGPLVRLAIVQLWSALRAIEFTLTAVPNPRVLWTGVKMKPTRPSGDPASSQTNGFPDISHRCVRFPVCYQASFLSDGI